jgi:hypothetical protein
MRTIFQVMNQTAFSRVLRGIPAANLVLAVAGVFSAAAMHSQTPADSSSQPASTSQPAPQTTTAAPGTAAVHGTGVAALQQNAITKYDNRYEIYGGLLYMNGQAGQSLPKRYDMGGAEFMGTYWLGSHFGIPDNRLGIAADYRIGAGTTPVLAAGAQFGLNRILIYQNILSGGIQYRSIKNRYAAIDFHALAGASHGTFDTAITGYPQNTPQQPTTAGVGVYNNNTTPWGAVGGSIDFNYSPKVAIRLAPDLNFEHFGTETREFVSVTMGLVYRLGKR